jgi:hypothetical protein
MIISSKGTPIAFSPTYEQLSEAKTLAGNWFSALLKGDINTLVKLTGSPFYYGGERFTENELPAMYQNILKERPKTKEKYRPNRRPPPEYMQIKSIKTITQLKSELAELISRGRAWPPIERVLQSLALDYRDLVIESMVKVSGVEHEDSLFLFIRNVDDQLKVTGIAG